MRPSIQPLGAPLVDEDVARLERDLGCALPDAYRRFLLTHNGGAPTPQGAWVRSSNRLSSSQVFFGVGLERTAEDLLVQRLELMRGQSLPAHYLPIGREVGGDYLLLQLAGPERGAVVTLPHDRDLVRDDGVFMRSELLALASDFDVLLDAFGDEGTLSAAQARSPSPQTLVGRAFGRHVVTEWLGTWGASDRFRLASGWLLERFAGPFAPAPGAWSEWRAEFDAGRRHESKFTPGLIADVIADGDAALVVYAERPNLMAWHELDDPLLLAAALSVSAIHRAAVVHGAIAEGTLADKDKLVGFRPPGDGHPRSAAADARDLAMLLARCVRARGRRHEETWAALREVAFRPAVRASEVAVAFADLTATRPDDWRSGPRCETCDGPTLVRHGELSRVFRDEDGRRRASIDPMTELQCAECGECGSE